MISASPAMTRVLLSCAPQETQIHCVAGAFTAGPAAAGGLVVALAVPLAVVAAAGLPAELAVRLRVVAGGLTAGAETFGRILESRPSAARCEHSSHNIAA